jgi:DNA-binding protein HU-beta
MTVNKKDLVDLMADNAEVSKAQAEKALNAFLDGVKKSLKEGEKVALVGFGSFSVTERAARKGRNPQTGAEIDIPASKAPKFTASKEFKKALK